MGVGGWVGGWVGVGEWVGEWVGDGGIVNSLIVADGDSRWMDASGMFWMIPGLFWTAQTGGGRGEW